MSPDDLITFITRALFLTLKLSAPVVVCATLAGVLVSLAQAATQVNDQTLPFLVKLIVTLFALMIMGHWISRELHIFLVDMLDLMPMLGS